MSPSVLERVERLKQDLFHLDSVFGVGGARARMFWWTDEVAWFFQLTWGTLCAPTLRMIMPEYKEFDVNELTRAPLLQLGAPAPDFEAETTHGYIRLSTWRRESWVVFFSHPADFTPVCTTEFVGLSQRYDEFESRNVELLGLSVDSVYSHIAWVRDIQATLGVKIRFPIVADVDQRVSRLYNMIHRPTSSTLAIRAMFVIDPQRKLRAMMHYPAEAGRNIDEVLRLLDALQAADRSGAMAPEGWTPGAPMLCDAPTTERDAERDLNEEDKSWYLRRAVDSE